MTLQAPYSLEVLRTNNGSKIKIVNNNFEERKKLTLVVTIYRCYNKMDNGFKASAEFFEGDNIIEDVRNIIKNKGFRDLLEYYHNAIIDLPSKEGEAGGGGGGEALLNDDKFANEPIEAVKGTKFLGEVVRGIIFRSRSKMNMTLEPNFLRAMGSICQGFNVYTTLKNYNREEMIIARTSAGMGTYPNLTLFNRKLTTPLFYLHLANVLLTNRLLLRQTTDIISGIEKVVLYIRRRAIPYSLIIAAINIIAAAVYFTGSTSESEEFGRLFYLLVLPLIWPITAFIMRTYASKIFPIIVRYAIKRILQS